MFLDKGHKGDDQFQMVIPGNSKDATHHSDCWHVEFVFILKGHYAFKFWIFKKLNGRKLTPLHNCMKNQIKIYILELLEQPFGRIVKSRYVRNKITITVFI